MNNDTNTSWGLYKSVHIADDGYPSLLRFIDTPPEILWYQWERNLLQKTTIWTVWPRKPTEYVQMVLEKYLRTAMQYDHVTLSWWAAWVDTAVHKASIDAWIPTIVVLWMGLEKWLKSSRRGLYEAILAWWWLLLSEFHPTFWARNWTYPQRNRIISALSTFLYIPWWARGSGTEHTLKAAIKQNKPLYWTMGSVFDGGSALTNYYIAQGAMQWVLDIADLFDRYSIEPISRQSNASQKFHNTLSLSPRQEQLLWLCKSLQSLEELAHESWWSIEEVMVEVWRLEIAWLIKQSSTWKYLAVDT